MKRSNDQSSGCLARFTIPARGIGLSVVLLAGALIPRPGWAAESAIEKSAVHVEILGEMMEGRLLLLDSKYCWLGLSDGAIRRLPLSEIKRISRTQTAFQPVAAVEMRNRLRQELPQGYVVAARGDYLVGGPARYADRYADLLETVRVDFQRFFKTRGLGSSSVEFPLVVVVHENQRQFDRQCRLDGILARASLKGYYLRDSNRIHVRQPEQLTSSDRLRCGGTLRLLPDAILASDRVAQLLPDHQPSVPVWFGAGTGAGRSLRQTLIHEAIHQLTFNLGVLPRTGTHPRWLVEGLALMFESDGIRSGSNRNGERYNAECLRGIREMVQSGRIRGMVARLVASDQDFHRSPHQAYDASWALTFYLVEHRSRDFTRWLKHRATQDRPDTGSGNRQMREFQSFFGEDLNQLELKLVRFIEEL